jgi:hypothetical protein
MSRQGKCAIILTSGDRLVSTESRKSVLDQSRGPAVTTTVIRQTRVGDYRAQASPGDPVQATINSTAIAAVIDV